MATRINKTRKIPSIKSRFLCVLATISMVVLSGCTQLQKPEPEPFFAETPPPPKQEFRWSNGKLPRSFDPARASSAPETDIVRSLFDGLTDLDPKTLREIPALAEKWTSSDEFTTWRFDLRDDAKWSNGQPVTANDFVRSWKRLADLGGLVSHRSLLSNIKGFHIRQQKDGESPVTPDFLTSDPQSRILPEGSQSPTASPASTDDGAETPPSIETPAESRPAEIPKFGFIAEGDKVLKVTLIHPDKDFPKLVAHPMFRPVFGSGIEFEEEKLNAAVVSNGPFRITTIGPEGVTLDRSENYWNRDAIKLERVSFVPAQSAEKALDAYRKGNLDAVTNADFAPLALKLLEPFEDFRRSTFSALNFYEFNTAKAPFNDRRVRLALAIAIERENLTEGDLGGTTRPATSFLPFGVRPGVKLTQDKEKARELLIEAGYANGIGFPVIRLLINRNDIQQRIARSVARMWKQNLNLDTEIIVKETSELAAAKAKGEYDAIRRGIVLPTADETANFMAIFHSDGNAISDEIDAPHNGTPKTGFDLELGDRDAESGSNGSDEPSQNSGQASENLMIFSEEEALYEVRAIPLYFPTSYSLVKPYVGGFETNSLDSPSLKNVVIDHGWQPK